MEWWLIGLGVLVVLTILNTERLARVTQRDVARVDRKLNLILKELNIDFAQASALSERVRELARDPSRKIEAIKAYREETGVGLVEAKEAVEAWINSLQR